MIKYRPVVVIAACMNTTINLSPIYPENAYQGRFENSGLLAIKRATDQISPIPNPTPIAHPTLTTFFFVTLPQIAGINKGQSFASSSKMGASNILIKRKSPDSLSM